MHDPIFVLYHVKGLNLDIWHDEPGGKDAFTVCGWPPQEGLARLWWAIRHLRHARYRWKPYLDVKRWIVDRCDECGYRFPWKAGRRSYMSTDKVWHDKCMTLRSVRSELADITGYVRGTADSDARWRVEYRLSRLDENGVAVDA